MSETSTNTEPSPVVRARAAWQATQEALGRAYTAAQDADRRLSAAVMAPRPDRIDDLAAEAKAASTAWAEAIAAEQVVYGDYTAARKARS